LPIGAAKFPEGNLGALVATAIACSLTGPITKEPGGVVVAAAVIAGIMTAQAGSEMTSFVRRILGSYTESTVEAAATGHAGYFRARFLGAVGVHAVAGFLLTLIAYGLGRGVVWFLFGDPIRSPLASLPENLRLSGTDISNVMMGAGVAVVISRFVRKDNVPWFAGAAMTAFAARWLWA
jgi:hypothetical protein